MVSRALTALSLIFTPIFSTTAATPQSTAYAPEILRPHLLEVDGGRRLNFVCVGKGFPAVIFEQGGEGSILNWRKVQASVSATTRTCFYDRAGFGFSDPPSRPVTAMAVTDDLHTLLRRAGVELPLVLVGHSIGGFYATMYADRFGADVAGLVLVDPGFAGQFNPRTSQERTIEEGNIARGDAQLRACGALAREGKLSEKDPHDCFSPTGWLWGDRKPSEVNYLDHMFTGASWYEAEAEQSENFFTGGSGKDSEDTLEERAASRSFGHMPVIVLTASTEDTEPGQSPAAHQAFLGDWKRGHDGLAARSTRGLSLNVSSSDHFIQLNQPQAVVDAIETVIREVRGDHTQRGGR